MLTVDGVGEDDVDRDLARRRRAAHAACDSLPFPHSLGLLYAALTAYLGFEVNEGEYKVMGLAAFGEPRFRDAVRRAACASSDDGSFELDLDYFAFTTDTERRLRPAARGAARPAPRPSGAPWDLEATPSDRRYADVAATLQAVTEEALLGAGARGPRARTGCDALCLAGGVALNAVANARIAPRGGLRARVRAARGGRRGRRARAPPSSARSSSGDPRPRAVTPAALGAPVRPGEADALAASSASRRGRSPIRRRDRRRWIARGKIVAVARGRFEWGPRALGQRSILALRRTTRRCASGSTASSSSASRSAPSRPPCSRRRAARLFDGAPNDMTPFMTTVCPVRAERAGELGAGDPRRRHARACRRVDPAVAPEFAALLDAVGAAHRRAVVLNTSLNGPGEPIVAGPDEALAFFLAHPVDAMVVGDALVARPREAGA